MNRSRVWSWGVLAGALMLVVSACGGGGDSATLGKRIGSTVAPTTTVAITRPGQAPPAGFSQTATAKVASLAVYPSANASQPSMTLPNPWVVDSDYPTQTVPQVFLVRSQSKDGWVQVLLPVRPNNTTGWVPESALGPLHRVRTWLRIDTQRFRITLLRAGHVVFQARIGVGRP